MMDCIVPLVSVTIGLQFWLVFPLNYDLSIFLLFAHMSYIT
jgi:hypothetical protein